MSSPPEAPARERILGAAWDAFMEHGFADATMLDIATRARVSKRELYALVGNKEEMLEACIASHGSRMRLPEGREPVTDRRTFHAALRGFGATLLREMLDPAVTAAFRLGITEARRSPSIARSIDARGRQPARAALAALLGEGRACRLLAEGDLAEMASIFRALLLGDLMVWILLGLEKAPTAKEIDRRANRAATVFMATYGR